MEQRLTAVGRRWWGRFLAEAGRAGRQYPGTRTDSTEAGSQSCMQQRRGREKVAGGQLVVKVNPTGKGGPEIGSSTMELS